MLQYVDRDSGLLFSSRGLDELLQAREQAVKNEVDQIEEERLLNTAPNDLVEYLVDKYTLEAPTLSSKDKWVADAREVFREFSDYGRIVRVPGQRIEVEIPFDGEPELLLARASTYSVAPPHARVSGHSLVISLEIMQEGHIDIGASIERTVREIDECLAWTRKDVDAFNSSLQALAQKTVELRRDRLLRYRGRVVALGIPVRQRAGAPSTYSAPTVRRKVVPTLPKASSVPYEPEPVLDQDNYEHILKVVQNMTHVMERSPSAFQKMDEEALRQHFLVQLNGQFEGAATGETFNVSGKTDILLRYKDRNIFIAECKYWRGPKQFSEAIDQLLSYAAWRDTKTAIFVFNKGTAMTSILAGVKEQAEKHPNYKRTEVWKHESGFRFVLHHRADMNRELMLTVLVFDVPA